MQYVSGIHALNIKCSLDTCGDWHAAALQWSHPCIHESQGSLFGDYGIELDRTIPEHSEKFAVANHIRALLDMLERGQFALAQGMRKDFICNDSYDGEVFEHVWAMRRLSNWPAISSFMGREYAMRWLNFIRSKEKAS